MPTRPERIQLTEGQQAWDAEVDANFAMITSAPVPIHTEPDFATLTLNFDATLYEDCFAIAGGVLCVSDGVAWSIYKQSDYVLDSTATTVAELAGDYNILLDALKTSGIMEFTGA